MNASWIVILVVLGVLVAAPSALAEKVDEADEEAPAQTVESQQLDSESVPSIFAGIALATVTVAAAAIMLVRPSTGHR